ncbi:MAG: ATP-binding protein [Coprobacillaceae bacterium]
MKYRISLVIKIFCLVFLSFLIVLFVQYLEGVDQYIDTFLDRQVSSEYKPFLSYESEMLDTETPDIGTEEFDKLLNDWSPHSFEGFTHKYVISTKKEIIQPYFNNSHTCEDSTSYGELTITALDESSCTEDLQCVGTFSYGSESYINLSSLTIEEKQKVIDTISSSTKKVNIEVSGDYNTSERLHQGYETDDNGNQKLVTETTKRLTVTPTYLKINDVLIKDGDSSNTKSTQLIQYLDEDVYIYPTTNQIDYPYVFFSLGLNYPTSHKTYEISKTEKIAKEIIQNYSVMDFPLSQSPILYQDGDDYYLYNIGYANNSNEPIQGFVMMITAYPDLYGEMQREYIQNNMSVYIISCILVLCISIIVSFIIVRPIKKIEKVAKKITDNDFSEDLNIKSHDELGNLGCSINTMSKQLELTLHQLQEEIEQVKKLESVRKDFIARFTHEIKTPLAIINGYSELIPETHSEEKRKQYLNIIDKETQKINTLVLAMLDLSKLESNQVSLEISDIDLEEIITDIIDDYTYLLQNDELKIQTKITPTYIKGDEDKIRTVISNFLSNAITHTPKQGNIYITLNKNYLSIENEGLPITSDIIENIWESFYSRNTNGTGLGLAICKAILELHRFSFGVENTIRGVKFYIHFQ